MADRKFLEIDVDNFDDRLKACKPRVAFQVPNTLTGEGNLSVEMTFESMDDFSPAAVARKVDALNKLLQARTELANLLTYMDGKDKAEELVGKLLNNPELMKSLSRRAESRSPAKPSRSSNQEIPMMPPETAAQGAAAARPPRKSTSSKSLLNKEFKARDPQKQTRRANAPSARWPSRRWPPPR